MRRLNPFAVDFRYEDARQEEAVDRSWAVNAVRRVKAWVEGVLREHAR